jgi:hypothetical protein
MSKESAMASQRSSTHLYHVQQAQYKREDVCAAAGGEEGGWEREREREGKSLSTGKRQPDLRSTK